MIAAGRVLRWCENALGVVLTLIAYGLYWVVEKALALVDRLDDAG